MRYGEVAGVGKPVSRLVQGTVMLAEADQAASIIAYHSSRLRPHGCRSGLFQL